MCKDCGCSAPKTTRDLDELSHLAAYAHEHEHARLHELGFAHDHGHEHDHGHGVEAASAAHRTKARE